MQVRGPKVPVEEEPLTHQVADGSHGNQVEKLFRKKDPDQQEGCENDVLLWAFEAYEAKSVEDKTEKELTFSFCQALP